MSFKIDLNGITLQQQGHQTILDAIVAATPSQQVLIDYQCKDGYCGTCRCKLVSGKVGYIKPTLAFLDENEILPCCAIALSDIALNT